MIIEQVDADSHRMGHQNQIAPWHPTRCELRVSKHLGKKKKE